MGSALIYREKRREKNKKKKEKKEKERALNTSSTIKSLIQYSLILYIWYEQQFLYIMMGNDIILSFSDFIDHNNCCDIIKQMELELINL